MDAAFIAFGHGYESPSMPGMERCTAFDGYEIIAEPLGGFSNEDRARRVFGRNENGNGGTCYGSHAIKLARRADDPHGRKVYILGQHGSGREVLAVPLPFDRGASLEALLTLPEAALYGVLYGMWQAAANARREAIRETADKWGKAIAEGRIRKRRASKGRPARIEIMQPWEVEARKRA